LAFSQTTTTAPINSEGVSISSTVTPPHPSAMLEIQSTNKGLLIPRTSDKFNVANPTEGLLVYETGTNAGFYFWNGTAWQCMSCCGSTNEDWKIIGSTDLLSNGKLVPQYSHSGSPAEVCNIKPTSSTSQLLSIRKLVNGKVQIRGEFTVGCNLDTWTKSCNFLFEPGDLSVGYKPISNSVELLSPILINGQAASEDISGIIPSICNLPWFEIGIKGISLNLEDYPYLFPVGTKVYINIQYDAN
jgi:hypothetical protein